MTSLIRVVAVVPWVVACVAGCKRPVEATAASCKAEDPEQVVATWNGKSLTLREVDLTAGDQIRELDKQRFQARKQVIEQSAIQALVRAEAAKQGKTEEAWLDENIDAKIPAPPEAEIQKIFDENKAQMPPGATVESMRKQLISYINRDPRQQIALKLFEELKKKANYEFKLTEPQEPRVTVEAKGPARGPADAKVTIVEFSDFECPFCSRAEETVEQVMSTFAGKVRLVFRHYPLPIHANAGKAAEATACAAEQGKFWELHKQLFANQSKLAVPQLKEHAAAVGADAAKFAECLDSGRMKALVDADQEAGEKAGVRGTPAFFINGVRIAGAQPFSEFERIITRELASAK